MAGRNILVIEDSPDLGGLLSLHLKDLGYAVRVEKDGADGLNRARSDPPDLIILDLMLPGMDGLDVCRALRADADFTPILMLTARSSEAERVLGLETGADDYLVKPFSIPELLARVNAIFRRLETFAETAKVGAPTIKAGGLVLDLEKRRVHVDGAPVELTAKEFDLLAQFAGNPGRVYTRSQLLDLIWGHGNASYEHTVNSHINRLRAKIERDPSKPDYVLTAWGVGYKFNDRTER